MCEVLKAYFSSIRYPKWDFSLGGIKLGYFFFSFFYVGCEHPLEVFSSDSLIYLSRLFFTRSIGAPSIKIDDASPMKLKSLRETNPLQAGWVGFNILLSTDIQKKSVFYASR